ncbi:MAG: hypothetical protein ACJA0T_002033 [Colwellia sp.]|jgi:hypothetical protein
MFSVLRAENKLQLPFICSVINQLSNTRRLKRNEYIRKNRQRVRDFQ